MLRIFEKWGAKQQPEIKLSSEEREWLDEKHTVRVRIGEHPPWEINTPEAQGMSVDYLRIIGDLFGINFEFVPAQETWLEGFRDVAGEHRHYDLIPAAKRTEVQLSQLAISDNYLSSPWVIFARKHDQLINSLDDLRNKTIAVEDGNTIQALLETTMPEIKLVTKPTTRDALLALSTGDADAYVGNMIVTDYLLQAHGINNLRVAGHTPFGNHDQAMATRKEWAPLISIINKGLGAIPAEQHIAIRQKWLVSIQDNKQPAPFVLNAEEQNYLAGITFLRGQSDNWMPLSFNSKDAAVIGIVEDYWKLVCGKLGLKEKYSARKPFAELLQMMQKNEVDIIPGTSYTADRDAFAVFSDSYEQHPFAIATRKEAGFFTNASVLEGQVVAVADNHSTYQIMKERFPGIQFLPVRDAASALSRVAAGEAYAAIDILPVLQYHIEQFHGDGIKLSGVTDVQFPLQVMISRQHERLLPLINRAIAAITDEERAQIHKKWMLREVVRATDFSLLWQVLFFSVTMLSLILYWNYRLRYEVRERTQAERLLSESESALLQAKEKAEAANEAKPQFLANISHELRTPMHALIGFEYLMRQTRLSPVQADYLDKIHSSSRLLLGVIDDVLDASKIESGHIVLRSVQFNPAEILREISDLLEVQAREKGLGFYIEAAENIPGCLMGDPQRLTQILLNLAGNAVKFTEQGEVCVQVSCPSQNQQQSCLRFSVKDTGPGISKAQQQRLFQRFVQLDSSLTRMHQGSGLGLAISQAFAQRMGGKIELDSKPGQGSTFTLTVEFHHCSEDWSEHFPVSPGRIVPGAVHVLLAEDNALNQLLTVSLLESTGVSVTVANNGAEVLEKLTQADFSLLLMDLQMPKMDGYETTRLVREQRKWDNLPIIAMTAHTAAAEREKCLAAGMNDYLGKPFRQEELVSMLIKWTVID
ncbi:MAG: transporter substrate-binding domain-containing protein [Thiolinea sp.]